MDKQKTGPVTALKASFERLEKDCKEHKEAYLRALADFDNYRRRVERDSEVSRRMALEKLLLDLLPVMDNFDRALAAVGGEQAASVQKGMELIHKQLSETLCKHGLTAYSCVGTEFDPRRAEAISFVQTEVHEPNMVVTEVCKGYSCGERVLRPARVVVAKEPSRSQMSDARSEKLEVTEGQELEEERSQKLDGRS